MSDPKRQRLPQVSTLMAAHDALVAIRPRRDAALTVWHDYHLRSSAVYAEIAEIDRGHHHEALYWADREKRTAEAISEEIKKGGTTRTQ
ncbi:hypothetical protein EV191_101626 [Tamaricihabitans halophyticus]|uniref:Uncharacterized protein n=1 Tax=Tamaricihabitans halophyticus TaxID=1262583 RepID=A0A4R2R1U5_9PSEU|nr:AMED_5909 family protein [Tamaricihabitans halophyticus]TCP56680.1 hypothetical protein EV191_101626 [Tamaricihabitans halophyticus]